MIVVVGRIVTIVAISGKIVIVFRIAVAIFISIDIIVPIASTAVVMFCTLIWDVQAWDGTLAVGCDTGVIIIVATITSRASSADVRFWSFLPFTLSG